MFVRSSSEDDSKLHDQVDMLENYIRYDYCSQRVQNLLKIAKTFDLKIWSYTDTDHGLFFSATEILLSYGISRPVHFIRDMQVL